MNKKEMQSADTYDQMMQQKEDANMHYVAKIIHEEYYMPTEEELAQVVIPEDLHNKMLAMARELDKKREREYRRRRILRFSKLCAVFIVCFLTVGMLTINSAEAFKLKLRGLFPWVEDDHVVLNPYDYSELEEWNDYYIFAEVPAGYAIVSAEQSVQTKKITFAQGDNRIMLNQYSKDVKIYADIESYTYEEVFINGNTAFYIDKGSEKSLIMLLDNYIIDISIIDEIKSKEDIIQLATTLKYVE